MIKRLVINFWWLLVVCLACWLLLATSRAFVFTNRTEGLINRIEPYQQIGRSDKRLLIIGDSAAYGTGTSSSRDSLAGLIGRYFPSATLANKAQNGTKTEDLATRIHQDIARNYDIIFIIVGANDVAHPEVNLAASAQHLDKIYAASSSRADHVVAITTYDFTHNSFFLPPLNYYFGNRSKSLNSQASAIAQKYPNIHYINSLDVFDHANMRYFEAEDHFHINDVGTHYWFKHILRRTNNLEF